MRAKLESFVSLNPNEGKEYLEMDISNILLNPSEEMKNGITSTKLYYENIIDKNNMGDYYKENN